LLKEPCPGNAAIPCSPPPTLLPADFVANSWPNSGFRNTRQRVTRGR
jgi:hypothetical protein